MKRAVLTIIVIGACALPTLAPADWNEGDPAKWVQLPDPLGWDVKVTSPKTLADDFPCHETGWITDVHFWGSWKDDVVGQIDRIHLSFHKDIPAGVDPEMPWSHPGELLWGMDIDPIALPVEAVIIREYGTGEQGWYDPNSGEYIRDDHDTIWQVNIFLDKIVPCKELLFLQEEGSSPTDPSIYWLDIQVNVSNPQGAEPVGFGWKTALGQWRDDAVYRDEMPPVFWRPIEDPVIIRSLDLAFVLTGVPIPEPGVFALGGFALLGLIALRRRK